MLSTNPTTPGPESPSSAGIDHSLRHPVMFFITCGAAWLVVSIVCGVIASAKLHGPDLLGGWSWLAYGRLMPAHLGALVYGWGMQVAVAVIIWLMARMSNKECTAVGTILTAGVIWNIGVASGILGILSGNGTGISWLEFPAFVWPVLLVSYCAIVVWSFIQFWVRPAGVVEIAQWYNLAAMIWFPWIFITANTLLHWLPGHPLMGAAVNAWYKSAMVWLFFTPVALGAAYALAAQVAGSRVVGGSLARLGFWSLAVIAPWAGMQKLAGAPVPYFLPYVGAAATALLFIPVCAAVTDMLRLMGPGRTRLAADPALRFTIAGLVWLVGLAVELLVFNLPGSTLRLTQFSVAGYGFEIVALYGFFSLVMFGVIYWMVPCVTGCEWRSRKFIDMHWLFSIYGMVTVICVTMCGGLQQGLSQEKWLQPWLMTAASLNPYAVAMTFGWCLILFANVFFGLNLATMWLHIYRRNIHQPTTESPQQTAHGDANSASGDWRAGYRSPR